MINILTWRQTPETTSYNKTYNKRRRLDARRRLWVFLVWLSRTDEERNGALKARRCEYLGYWVELLRIAGFGAGAVRFDVCNQRWVDICLGVDLFEQAGLHFAAWECYALVFGAVSVDFGVQDLIDFGVESATCWFFLQKNSSDCLTSSIAFTISIERLAFALLRKHAQLLKLKRGLWTR